MLLIDCNKVVSDGGDHGQNSKGVGQRIEGLMRDHWCDFLRNSGVRRRELHLNIMTYRWLLQLHPKCKRVTGIERASCDRRGGTRKRCGRDVHQRHAWLDLVLLIFQAPGLNRLATAQLRVLSPPSPTKTYLPQLINHEAHYCALQRNARTYVPNRFYWSQFRC